jgi:hypothetical protein
MTKHERVRLPQQDDIPALPDKAVEVLLRAEWALTEEGGCRFRVKLTEDEVDVVVPALAELFDTPVTQEPVDWEEEGPWVTYEEFREAFRAANAAVRQR